MKKAVAALVLSLMFFGLAFGNGVADGSPRLTSITLERTGCMGTCPVYRLTLNDSGEATYTGFQYVPRIGVYTSYVDFPLFLEMIEPHDPWSLQDAGPFATDSPSLTITMAAGKHTKTVHLRMYVSMPPRFASIVAAMDGITAYSVWKSVGASVLAGTYIQSDGVNALDELSIVADREGNIGAFLTHADSSSCEALLLAKPVSLGRLTLTEPGVARTGTGIQITKIRDGVLLDQAGKQRWFYAISTGAEMMLRSALEHSIIHKTLHSCD